MNKYTYIALALAPMVCITAQATPEEAAQTTIKAAITNLTTQLADAKNKDLPTLISELDALLSRSTPEILATLEPLTDEQRLAVITGLMQAPELSALMAAVESLNESKAAASVMPAIGGATDPASFAASMPLKTKLQAVDITANLLKIALGLGIDSPTVQSAFFPSCGEEECAE